MGKRRNPGCRLISHIAYLSENIVRGQDRALTTYGGLPRDRA